MARKYMKIAMVGQKRVPSHDGGIEVVVGELAKRMVAQGHSVTCYNRTDKQQPQPENFNGISLKYVPTIQKKGLAAVSASFFACLCAAVGNYDVVHVHAEGPALFCWLPKLMGKRVIVTVHGLDWTRAKWQNGIASKCIKLGEEMAVRHADELIVLSHGMKQYFADTYGRETLLIPNGVPSFQPCAPELIRQYGLEKDNYILYLGRIVPEKGEHYLIEAYKHLPTDKKLVIAGGASDSQEYFDELREMAKDDDRVIFLGFVQGQLLAELYSNAYTYVLPSDVEGMPLSLMEAMSYGCCVHRRVRLRRSGARRDLPPRQYRRFARKAGGFAGESGEGGKVQGGSAGLHLPFAQLGHGDAADAGGLSRGCTAGRAASGFAAGSADG